MSQISTVKVNKINRAFVAELNEKFPDSKAEYRYYHEKGGYVPGYDGNEGFEKKETRSATLSFYGSNIYKKSDTWQDNFGTYDERILKRHFQNTIKDIHESKRDANGQPVQVQEWMIRHEKEATEILQKLNEVYNQPITKEEAIHDFTTHKRDRMMTLGNPMYEHLRDDKDVVRSAINNSSTEAFYISDKIKDDKEFMLEHLNTNPYTIFQACSDRLKSNKEFVLEVVKMDESALYFASDEIKRICDGKNPIEALEKSIDDDKKKALYQDIQKKLKPSAETKPTQSLKI